MDILIQEVNKSDFLQTIEDLLVDEFSIPSEYANSLSSGIIWPHIDPLIDDVWIVIESPYVDKVYRNSYYHYFSSKSGQYKKDCIRLSFFSEEIPPSAFRDPSQIPQVQKKYLGFMILRPTTPLVIGRSTISPNALKNNGFLSCAVDIHSTALMVKFHVRGFPHSSQDTETITCAETTIWALLEYFSNRYAEYMPVLPSQITEALRNVSSERQIPSKGLNIQQMAYALGKFGFGPRIYDCDQFGEAFFPILSTYIESGIPLVLAIESDPGTGDIAHALLCIGHEAVTEAMIDNLKIHSPQEQRILDIVTDKSIQLFDSVDFDYNYVFIDDNRPTYQLSPLSAPASNYQDPEWHGCKITHFMAPLYPKIYLEAYEAKKYFMQLLFNYLEEDLPDGIEIVIRFYLASSRSLKHAIALNVAMNEDLKTLILDTAMPKFVWVGELSNKALLKCKKANGIFLLDATEANYYDDKPLILGAFLNKFLTFGPSGSIDEIILSFPEFDIFTHNLGGF